MKTNLGVGFWCAFVSIGWLPVRLAAGPGAGGPLSLPDAVGFSETVSGKDECGEDCAVQVSGESAVKIEFKPKNLVRVTDVGKLTRRENNPDGTTTEERAFRFVFKGGWFNAGGARELSLTEEQHSCQQTLTRGEKTEKAECPRPDKRISLRCTRTTVTARAASGPVEVEALSCAPLNQDDYPGTAWPWVFGLSKQLRTIRSGEPRPVVSYQVD